VSTKGTPSNSNATTGCTGSAAPGVADRSGRRTKAMAPGRSKGSSTEVVSRSVSESVPEVEAEADAESLEDADTEKDCEAESDSDVETVSVCEIDVDSVTDSVPLVEVLTDTVTDSVRETEIDPDSDTDVEIVLDSLADVDGEGVGSDCVLDSVADPSDIEADSEMLGDVENVTLTETDGDCDADSLCESETEGVGVTGGVWDVVNDGVVECEID
jgi:hypothetical protein